MSSRSISQLYFTSHLGCEQKAWIGNSETRLIQIKEAWIFVADLSIEV
jgi:hypothetical protein